MKFIKFFVIALFLVLADISYAGGDGAHGGDMPNDLDGTVWFLAESPVNFCFEISPDFGASVHDAATAFDEAFSIWNDYLRRHSTGLARSFVRLQSCNGSEDLKIYLGVNNSEVNTAKKAYFNPFAFVKRTSYSLEKRWGQGFIWIASSQSVDPSRNFPDWSAHVRLVGVFLHELGHIFGCAHVAGTIMDENIFYSLKKDPNYAKPYLSQIDHFRELVNCVDSFYGRTCIYDGKEKIIEDHVFTQLVGRLPKGIVKSTLTVTHPHGALALRDENGSYSFPLVLSNLSDAKTGYGVDVFKEIYRDSGRGISSTSRTSFIEVSLGTINAPDGKTYQISVKINIALDTPVALDIFLPGKDFSVLPKSVPLFAADWVKR